MTVIENMPQVDLRSAQQTADLRVDPQDISFHDLPGDRVLIQVTVHNQASQTSQPTAMRLESAPLGAFVPWRPLGQLIVPALQPGESRQLSTEAKRSRPAALGEFDRVPPKRLLTAVNSADDEPEQQPGMPLAALRSLFGRQRTTDPSAKDSARKSSVAPDLWDLLGRGQPHWAGNINVFIGAHAVERHVARALRIYPGKTNLAMFIVGDARKPDAYSFELNGLAADWNAALYNVTDNARLLSRSEGTAIEETRWIESNGGLMVMLATQPPADAQAGNLEVHVTRRSCQKSAVVEFDLDPAAQGTGCYFI